MNLFDIAFKDIRQILRDWKSAMFLLVMPVLFTVFFGLVMNPAKSGGQPVDPRLPVGWINQDSKGMLSQSFETLLAGSEVIRLIPLTGAEAENARDKVAKGELAAAVRMPAGYSQAILAGRPASLEVIADQSTGGGRTAVSALDTLTGRLLGAVESAHLSVETNGDPSQLEAAFQQAAAAWNVPPLTVRVEQGTGAPRTDGTGIQVTGFTQSSAGMIVQFAIFGLINSAMLLVLERKTHCLQRLLTTPVRKAEIIAGHILAMVLVVFFQQVILILMGQYVFGVDYLRQPWAILVMMIALALWSASLGLLIGAFAQKEEQVIVLCLIAMFIFSALGGAWFPLDVAGKTFSSIGHLLPSAWAMDGFQNIVLRGLGFESALLPAGLLLGYSLVFFALALARFRFE